MRGSIPPHDQTNYSTKMMFLSSLCNRGHNALALCNCIKLFVCDPFLVPFCLDLNLDHTLETQLMPSLYLGRGIAFQSAPCRQESGRSLVHSVGRCVHHSLPTYRNYRTIVGMPAYTSVTDDNYPWCVFILSNRSRTIMQTPRFALPMPQVLLASAILLPNSL